MNFLAKLTISTKIMVLLLSLGVVTIFIALHASRNLTSVSQTNTVMVNQGRAPVYLARSTRHVEEMQLSGYHAMAYDRDSTEAQAASSREERSYASAETLLDQAAAADPSLKQRITAIDSEYDNLHALLKRAILLGLSDKKPEAFIILKHADIVSAAVIEHVVTLNNAVVARDDSTAAALAAAATSTSFWLLTSSILAVVASTLVSLLVSRAGITGPLTRLKATMQALAAGDNDVVIDGTDRRDEVGDMAKVVLVFRQTAVAKAAADADKAAADATSEKVIATLGAALSDLSRRDLTGRVTADYPGAYAVLKDNYNDALDSVRATIQQVSESARTISAGSEEIAQASEDLARRTETNAASLERTSAALVEIESRVKATATASHSTVARADQAMVTVDSGRSTAETAMQAMGRVSGSAKGIDDVIEGLDKIAFQTRVLAMNAAVEAGRAGDAGRGFAVVADLVSALAMRAEEEAKRARDQLSVTQNEIVTAVEAVGKVDGALAAIASDVGEVNKLLAGMASDNQAQSAAVTEIATAIGSMDKTTQQNAAMVEETSAAARNLTQQVGTLARNAAQFRFERRVRNVSVAVDRRAGGTPAPTPGATAPAATRRASPEQQAAPSSLADRRADARVNETAEKEWVTF